MNKVWIVALVALGAAGGTIPADAAVGFGDGGPAIASALPGGTWSLLASAQILQIGQAGSDSAPEFGGLGGAGICLPGQEIDRLSLTRSPLTALEAPATFHAPEVALQAPETTAAQDRWVFSFSPYVWFPTTSATLTSGPLSTSFSVGPFQYGIPFGAMGHFTALKGKWGFFGDLVYANSF
jgi:hypothetical protein